MPHNRLDQARPFLTLLLVVLAWLAVPVVVKTFARTSFFELQAPVSVAASYARDLQEYWSLRLHSNSELIESGRDLARLVPHSTRGRFALSPRSLGLLRAHKLMGNS